MPKERQDLATAAENKSLPAMVPITLEGSYILHQMFRVRWPAWKAASSAEQQETLQEAMALLGEMEGSAAEPSALFSLMGHKGDLMLLHFRPSLDQLNDAEIQIASGKLALFLETTGSYLSVVELGLYEASVQLYGSLKEKGLALGSPDWNQATELETAKQRKAAELRLRPKMPATRYVCFYPMSKKRGEEKNWYDLPMELRRRMMREHGTIGRRYAGQVTQIISGSVGFDDWEWGVDLFANNPLVFKKLVYEMRFDQASAVYGLFGAFHVGLRFPSSELGTLLSGRLPGMS